MELKINSFGLFQNRSFALGQVTIFYGPNESGKTTIFDTIVSSLIRISGTTTFGKKLKDRYGDTRSAEISNRVLEIPASKFLNSYAIREGKVALDEEAKETKDLLTSIQNSLFDSGYSLKNLKAICLDRSSLKGNVKSGKDLNKAIEIFESKKSAWKKADEERSLTLSLWTDLPKKEKEKRELAEELKKKGQILTSLKKEREDLTNKQKHAKAMHLLQTILSWESKKSILDEIGKWRQSETDKLIAKLDEEIRQISIQLKEVQKNMILISENIVSIQKEIGETSVEREKWSKLDGVIFDIDRKLSQIAFENAPKIEKILWKKNILISGILCLVVGLGIAILNAFQSISPSLFWISGAIGFIGFFLILNFSKTRIITVDEEKLSKEIGELADEITLRTEGKVSPILKTRDGIREAIGKFKEAFTLISKKQEDLNFNLETIKQKKASMDQEELKSNQELTEKQRELKNHFEDLGVKSFQAFQEKLSDLKAEEQNYAHLNTQLLSALSDYSVNDIPSLKLKLKDEIQTFESSGIPGDFSQEEKQVLKNLIQRIELETKEYEKKKEIYFAKETELSGLVGGSQVKIKDVLEKWEHLRQEMEEAEANKLQVEKNIAAYRNLAQIFSEMDEGSENQMLGLVHSLSKRWNEILPEENHRNIEWNQLTEVPRSFDQTNVLRSVDSLSTGTKELFYFSLRLEYALRMSEEDDLKWLLFDEPFRHMDPKRMDSAVRYVLEFLKRENWQGVFFTFDDELKEKIMQNAKEKQVDCILHDLNVR